MLTSPVHALSLLVLTAVLGSHPGRSSMVAETGETIICERVVVITPVPGLTAQIIEGIIPVGFPWTVESGRAQANLNNRRFHISAQGLAIGAMPTPLPPIGTTGIVTSIRGSLVLTDIGIVIDTDSVELPSTGDAFINGKLSNESDHSNAENIFLLLRMAEALPGAPDITGFTH